MKQYCIVIFLLTCVQLINSQESISNKNRAILFGTQFGFSVPGSDLSSRYGNNLNLGAQFEYQALRKIPNMGINYTYGFGTKVKEDVLAPFRSQDYGLLIGADHYLADLKMVERLHRISFFLNGLIPLGRQINQHKGILLQLGLGQMIHYIKFQDDALALRQFYTAYRKGLDRYSSGLYITPSIGYSFLQNKGKFGFKISFESEIGFTKSNRSWNYDTNVSELGIQRRDILWTVKLCWILPFHLSSNAENIEY